MYKLYNKSIKFANKCLTLDTLTNNLDNKNSKCSKNSTTYLSL